MALQTSGQISVQDINTEINPSQPTVVRDLASAGILFGLDIDPTNWSDSLIGLGMDEFYGASTDGIIVTPNSFTFPNTNSFKDFSVISGTYPITITSNRIFFTVSNETTSSFRVTASDNNIVGRPARSGSVTVTSAAASASVTLTQLAGPTASIDIDPNIREIGGLTTVTQFSISTNAPAFSVVSTPSFVVGTSQTANFLYVTASLNNEPGAQDREGNIVVQTNTGIPGATEGTDSALLRQFAAPQESIQVVPEFNDYSIDVGGETKKFDVETEDIYNTLWEPFKQESFTTPSGVDWATIDTFYYDSAPALGGDGTIEVTFDPNPVGGAERLIIIGARKENATNPAGSAQVNQPANPASLTLTPSDDVQVDVNGNGSFTLETNANWIITGLAARNASLSPQSGIAGTYTINVNGTPTVLGTDGPLIDDITVRTNTGLNDIIINNYSLVQEGNPTYIDITFPPDDPTTFDAYGTSNFPITLDTNAPDFVISLPNFITLDSKDAANSQFFINIPQNNGAQRQGTISVTTSTPGVDEKTTTLTIIQEAPPDETIQLDPSFIQVGSGGQNNITIDVITNPFYTTSWTASIVSFDGGPTPPITFDGSTQGSGDGQITIDVGPATSTSLLRGFVRVEKTTDSNVQGNALVEQAAADPPSISVTPSLNFDRFGGSQNVTVTSNTSWEFSSIASWLSVSPSSGNGNTTVSITADPTPVGTEPDRSDVLVVTTTSSTGTNVSDTLTVTQDEYQATITLTPNGTIGVSATNAFFDFGVSTNAPNYSVSAPSYVTISDKTISGFTATWTDNNTGAERTGTITVTTIAPGGTNKSDDCDVTQATPTIPNPQISGTSTAPTNGSSGNIYTITTNYSFSWAVEVRPSPTGDNPIDITFTTSTSGTGDGQVEVTFGAYNGNGTETLRSSITVFTSLNGTEYANSVVVSQSPPPLTTYYIFDPCDPVNYGTVMADLGSAPSSNEQAVGSSSNYYTYSGTTTTNSSLHPIASLTLQGVTGCPTTPSCTSYTAINEGSSASTFGYTDCTSGGFRTFTLNPNESRTVCAQDGTFDYDSGDTNYSILEGSSC